MSLSQSDTKQERHVATADQNDHDRQRVAKNEHYREEIGSNFSFAKSASLLLDFFAIVSRESVDILEWPQLIFCNFLGSNKRFKEEP